MAKKTNKSRKHVPQRTCIGCRTVQPKRSMVRVVRTSEGVLVDPSGKLAGRGAYLHEQRSCWEKALKGPLAKALRCEISPQDRDRMLVFMASLPEEMPPSASEPAVET
ncbi:MAG: YlxR family protein [Anaerolineales bacterium]|nr:YlxR family protein [Anaerolineales bacterium]